jgi:hypothetical protein
MGHRVRKSTIIAIAAFLILIASGTLLLRWQDTWVAEKLAAYVSRNLLQEHGFDLKIGRFAGSLRGKYILDGVRVLYVGERREPFDLFRAERITLEFETMSLLRGDFFSSLLEIRGGEFRAFPIGGEGWAYPGFDSPSGERSDLLFSLSNVRLVDLQILLEIGEEVDSLQVGSAEFSIYRNAAGTALDIKRLNMQRTEALPVGLGGRIFLREGGNLTLAGLRLHLPQSQLEVRGYLNPSGGPDFNLDIDIGYLGFQEIAALAGEELLTENYIMGDIHVGGTPDSLLLTGIGSGLINDFGFENMEFTGVYSDLAFDFSRMKGLLNRNRVSGEALFKLPVQGRQFGMEADLQAWNFNLSTFIGEGLVTDLSGHARIYDRGLGQHFVLDLDAGSVDIYNFARARGDLHLREDTLQFQGIRVFDDGLEGQVDGVIYPEQGWIDLGLEGVSVSSELSRYFAADSCLEGDISFVAGFRGDLDYPHFRLDGELGPTEYLGTLVEGGQLVLETDSLALSPLSIEFDGTGVSRFGVDFNSIDFDGVLTNDSLLLLKHVSLDGTHGKVFGAGKVQLGMVPAPVELDRFWVDWLGAEWLNSRSLQMEVADSLFTLDSLDWISNKGLVGVTWGQADSTRDRIDLKEVELSQFSLWIPEILSAQGLVQGRLTRLPGGGFDLQATVEQASLDQIPAGDLELHLKWLGDSLQVEKMEWQLAPDQYISLHGVLQGLPQAQGDLAALAYLKLQNLRSDLELRSRQFPLDRLESLRGEVVGLEGAFSGDVVISGTLDDPLFAGPVRIDDFKLGLVALDTIIATLRSQQDRLRLSHVELHTGASQVEGWMDIPVDISIISGARVNQDSLLMGDLHLQGRGEDLLGMALILAEAGGDFEGDINLAGTPAHPQTTGYLRLRDGTMRLAGWEEKLDALNMDAIIKGDTIQVLSMHAREGIKWAAERQGEMSGAGWLTWHGPFRYHGDFDFTNGSVSTLPFLSGVVSGNIAIDTMTGEGILAHPFITGELDVHEGTVTYEFQDVADPTVGPSVTPIVSYDIGIKAENNIMLINRNANMELSGELRLSLTPTGQSINGELRTLRGNYMVFGNKFQLIDGYLDFSSADDLNPRIDILVETRYRNDRITIQIGNTFAEPEVMVVSEEGYSQEDVLRILMGLPVSGEGDISAGTVVTDKVEAELVNRLERLVSENLAGLVDFEIENLNLIGESDDETRMRIGGYLPLGLYWSYNSGLSLDSDKKVALEYRLYNRLYLKSEMLDVGARVGEEDLINEYNFDITFRWDF